MALQVHKGKDSEPQLLLCYSCLQVPCSMRSIEITELQACVHEKWGDILPTLK